MIKKIDIAETSPRTPRQMIKPTMQGANYTSALMKRVRGVISRREARMADLAKFLGKNWNQVHEWVVAEKHQPQAEATLGIVQWLTQFETINGRKVTMKGEGGEITLYEGDRKLSEFEQELWLECHTLRQLLGGRV